VIEKRLLAVRVGFDRDARGGIELQRFRLVGNALGECLDAGRVVEFVREKGLRLCIEPLLL
jgi:hypothetical protein